MRGWRLALFAFGFWCIGYGSGQFVMIAQGEWTGALSGKRFAIVEIEQQ